MSWPICKCRTFLLILCEKSVFPVEYGLFPSVSAHAFSGAGRAYFSAPDIDGKVYFDGDNVEQGKYYNVKIVRANAYDLYGRMTDEFTE